MKGSKKNKTNIEKDLEKAIKEIATRSDMKPVDVFALLTRRR